MQIKVKIEHLPPVYKGHDIMFLKGGKDFAEIVVKNGERQAYYNHQIPSINECLQVSLYLFANEQYFVVELNEKITNCVYL